MGFTVQQFYEAGRESLQLELECGGAFLDREISEPAMNRPGLALAGFFRYMAFRRVQVFGLGECSYLNSLQPVDRLERLRELFRRKIPVMVMTRNRKVSREISALSNEFRVPIFRSPLRTGPFMNAAAVLIERLTAPRVRVHATTVQIMGIGVMMEGDPGIGKSETALTLIERGHSLVSDDITILRRRGDHAIVATAVDVTRYHMEIRGLGIIHVPSLFGVASMQVETRLDLIVRLQRLGPEHELDRSGLTPMSRDVLDVQVPLINLPVAAGRDLAHVVEVAAMNQKLKNMGHDAAKELDLKLMTMLAGRNGSPVKP